jgi:hypothetical protein
VLQIPDFEFEIADVEIVDRQLGQHPAKPQQNPPTK